MRISDWSSDVCSSDLATGALSGFHNVRDYGAKGDGRTVDSDAINKAVMAASRAGGGTVIIPPGRYLSFSIRLQSHITLLIAQGAVLEAADPTRHPGQYDLPEGVYEEQYVDFGLAHYHNRSEEHTSELQSLMRN